MTAKTVKKKTKAAPKGKKAPSKAKAANPKLASVEGARERAEEVLARLQTRARELVEAREGLVATVTDLVEEKGLKPSDVKETLDGLLGRIKSNELWDELTGSDTVATLSDYREELERQVLKKKEEQEKAENERQEAETAATAENPPSANPKA